MKITLTKPNRKPCKIKTGYSFWTFCFGPLVPLVRGMPGMYVAKVWIISAFTFGLANIYWGFVINAAQLEQLLDEGWNHESTNG